MTLRQAIRNGLSNHPKLWMAYQQFKIQLGRVWILRYFISDMRNAYRNMYWPSNGFSPSQLTSELLFQCHKLEKGLVMPGAKRFFGEEPARAALKLLGLWESIGMSNDDPVYLGALETLQAYRNRLVGDSLDSEDKVVSSLTHFLNIHPIRAVTLTTPQPLVNLVSEGLPHLHHFKQLALARRSVRSFSPRTVPAEMLELAVELAQLSPSACNRQPCRVLLVRDEVKKKGLLALQNGNRGFGHLIPTLAVITADSSAFFNASERHEPYVDGGLFSMSLMYALSSQGLVTCCLNWCASPVQDNRLRKLLRLPENELVVLLMAIGYPDADALVARSPRKSTKNVMCEVV